MIKDNQCRQKPGETMQLPLPAAEVQKRRGPEPRSRRCFLRRPAFCQIDGTFETLGKYRRWELNPHGPKPTGF